ncbi:MAG: MBL fold metallo-hydrolase [Lachnotalea sp.]
MILKVLVDNNTYIDQYYLGEPAVSFYLEEEDKKILFDTGYSHVLIENAQKMGVDFNEINTVIFSHGHNDHTAGFQYITENYDVSKMEIVAHPACFNNKKEGDEEIGAPYEIDKLRNLCKVNLSSKPIQISNQITFLGEIPSSNNFEKRKLIGSYQREQSWVDDYVMDDSAIVYQDEEGLFIITGCSHSGICNIIDYAKKVCNEDTIKGIIGGFHLFEKDEVLEHTIKYFQNTKIQCLYPCHCVSFQVKARLNEVFTVHEVGVGLTLEI